MPASLCSSTGCTEPPSAAIQSSTGELRPPPTTTRSAVTSVPSSSFRAAHVDAVGHQADDAHAAAPRHVGLGGDGVAQHPLDGEAAAAQQHQVLVARPGLAILDVGRQDPLDRELGGALGQQGLEHVGRPLAQDATQAGQQGVRLAGVGRTLAVPPVERLVGRGGQVGVVALVDRDLVAVAREQQGSQQAGHAAADDGDVLRIVDPGVPALVLPVITLLPAYGHRHLAPTVSPGTTVAGTCRTAAAERSDDRSGN